MKVVILAGGFGSRLSEETELKPKPMVEIGGKPILWHIMKIYSHYGFNEFVICLGYKGHVIKEYFSNYHLYNSNVTFDLSNDQCKVHNNFSEPWKVTLVDTGLNTMTGGRLQRVRSFLKDGEDFLMTYGDGVSDVNINKLIEHHKKSKCLATMTVVKPPARFGAAMIENEKISEFREKAISDDGWINGGFFILNTQALDYIENEQTIWERGPLEKISKDKQLAAFKHESFWRPMDTLRDKNFLEDYWNEGNAPWKVWDDNAWWNKNVLERKKSTDHGTLWV